MGVDRRLERRGVAVKEREANTEFMLKLVDDWLPLGARRVRVR